MHTQRRVKGLEKPDSMQDSRKGIRASANGAASCDLLLLAAQFICLERAQGTTICNEYRLTFSITKGDSIMRVTYLARLLDVSADTIRRWIDDYRPFLTLKASSVKGSRSLMTEHDARVLTAISQLHNSGLEHSAINECLKHMQEKGWRDLPTLPRERDGAGSALSVGAASGSESEQIQVAVLQKEVEYAREALHRIQSRIEQLETQLQAVNDEKDEVIRQKRALELELVQTKNALSLLKTELNAHGRAYNLRIGWERFQVKLVLGTGIFTGVLMLAVFVIALLLT